MGWLGSRRGGSVVVGGVLLGLAALAAVGAGGRSSRPRRLSPGGTSVAEAARDGNLDRVRALIAGRAAVNLPTQDGSTALLWATYHGDLEMVGALIEAGAATDFPNRYGITPLLQASRSGDTAVVEALLAAGAGVAPRHPLGQTALMAAARTGQVALVRLLLRRGADVNAADAAQNQTALMWAAAEGHLGVVELLLAAGADPNARAHATTLEVRFNADFPSGGFTALMWAARNGHAEVVRRLLDGGADPNLTNGDGATAMSIAIVNDRLDIAALLLERGADANDGSLYHAVDMHDATTDMYALDGSRLRPDHPNRTTAMDLIEQLLARGADPNKPVVGQLHSATLCCGLYVNASGFYRAAVASDVDALRLMTRRGADLDWMPSRVDAPGADGSIGTVIGANQNVARPALHVAMEGGRGALIANGPGVHDREGPPPFREASNRAPLDAVALLLDAGANPDAVGPDGSTALHLAVEGGQIEIVRALAAAGAALGARNGDGLTPLALAQRIERTAAEAGPGPRRSAYNEPTGGPDLQTRHAMTTLLQQLSGDAPVGRTAAAGAAAGGGRHR